jgi:PAS domain S-box-containing protein
MPRAFVPSGAATPPAGPPASAATLVALLGASGQAVALFAGPDLTVVFATPAFASLVSAGTPLGRTFAMLFPAADTLSQALHEVRRTGVRQATGRLALPMTGSPAREWDGEILRVEPEAPADTMVALVLHDVTTLAEAERALVAERARVDETIDRITDGLLVLDRDWRYTFVSERAGQIVGMAPASLLGQCVWDLFPHAVGTRFHEGYLRAMATGQPVCFEEHYPAPIDRWLECRCYPSADALTVYFADVTDRRRAAVAHVRQQRLFEGISSTTPDFVYAFDRDGRFLYANRRLLEVWGVSLEEAVGRTCLELGYERWHHDMHLREIAEVIATRAPIKGEVPFRAPRTGIFGVYEYIFAPVLGPDGEVEIIAGTTRDITDRKQAEERARQSETFVRHVLDNLFAFVGVLTPDGTVIEVNRAPLVVAGLSESDVIGRRFWDCYWWSYSPGVQADLRSALDRALAGEVVRYDVPVRVAGGRHLWIDFQVAPLRDAQGSITHLVPSAMDISGRREAEHALRERERQLRLTLEAAHAGTFDIDFTPGTAPQVSDGARRLFGFPAPAAPSLEEFLARVHPEDMARVAAVIEDSARQEAGHYVEYRVLRPDHSIVWIASRAEVVRRDGNGPLRLTGVLLDITERKAAEAEVVAGAQRLELALAAGRTGLFDWDIRRGEATLTGLLRDLVPGVDPESGRVTLHAWQRSVVPEDADRLTALFDAAFAARQESVSYEFRVHAGAGVRWLGARGRIEYDAEGRPCRMLGANVDITERKRAEQALHEADRRKDEFLATLAHELRNPLAPLRNAVAILGRRDATSTQQDWSRGLIERQVSMMARLLDDLLDAARISRGKLELRCESVRLGDVLDAAIETGLPLIESRRHVLQVQVPDRDVLLQADPVRLCQVVANLLNNAAKYTPPGGQIELRAVEDGNGVRVDVRDTGIGLPAESLERVFELFSQLEGSRDASDGGLGIGLALVKGLVELHGGRVEVRSEGAGRGATFSVVLPRTREGRPVR